MYTSRRTGSIAQTIAQHPAFFEGLRDQHHHLFEGICGDFAAVFPGAQLRELALSSGLHHPDLRVVSGGPTPTDEYVFPSGLVDVVAVSQLVRQGHSIILQQFHQHCHDLALVTREFEATFGCNAQSNVYISPANSAALPVHFDSHDVFVLQLTGSKVWDIYQTAVTLPTSDMEFDPVEYSIDEQLERIIVSQGDVLYVPRGVPHQATALDEGSVHVTIGIFWPTYADLAADLLRARTPRVEGLRRTLPVQLPLNDEVGATVLSALIAALNVTPDEVVAALSGRQRQMALTRQPLVTDIDEQRRRLTVATDSSVVRARWPMLYTLEASDDSVTVTCCGHDHNFDSEHGPILRRLFDQTTTSAGVPIPEFRTAELSDLLEQLVDRGMVDIAFDPEDHDTS